jgi:hypothetical protein
MEIDYSSCVFKKYPDATLDDFLFEDAEGNGTIVLTIWNETKLGTKPSLEELTASWIDVYKDQHALVMDSIMYDEITNGTSGYMLQGLNSNFRIDSGRDDLDNMKNLRDYCRQMIVAFTNGSYPANLGGQVTNNHPVNNPTGDWYGVISSFAVESGDWITQDAQGVGYLNNCKGTLTIGDPVYMYDNPDRPLVAMPVYILKDNMSQTAIKGFDNSFHPVTLQELDVIIFELQAYGLWLYQNKWTKVAQIMACTTIEEIDAITFL